MPRYNIKEKPKMQAFFAEKCSSKQAKTQAEVL
jgi:hypothetical protein